MKEKIAVFPGSFDPFTIGHFHVLFEAIKLFDKVYVVIEDNPNKQIRFEEDVYTYSNELNDVLKSHFGNSVEVRVWNGLTVDACKWLNANYIIRGIRDVSDYLYEEKISKANDIISDRLIQTIYFRADSDISSSLVRELYKYGHDNSQFIPHKEGERI